MTSGVRGRSVRERGDWRYVWFTTFYASSGAFLLRSKTTQTPKPLMPIVVARILVGLSVITFLTALCFDAFVCRGKTYLGYEVLSIGWAGVIGLDPRWFANVGFLVLVHRSWSARGANLVLWATVLLAFLSFLPAAACPVSGGSLDMSKGLALGGILWVLALLLACAASGTVTLASAQTSVEEVGAPR
jgi:hypothetical protein